MIQKLELPKHVSNMIRDSNDLEEIKQALDVNLYVPDIRLKPKIIEELLNYFNSKFSKRDYKIKIFIAYNGSVPCGFVSCEINPLYKSYNRKCATFGWLNANSYEVCKDLMNACENFVRKNNIRIIRGNINFPKGLGGIGIQEVGFNERMMYGVAFNDPKSSILDYLEKLKYKRSAEYLCAEVTQDEWDKGREIPNDIQLTHLSLKELIKKKDQILGIASDAFSVAFPDYTGGSYRYDEMMKIYSKVPDIHYRLDDNFDPSEFSTIQEFIESWESHNLEKVNTWVHVAINKETKEIIGIIFTLPDLYQLWLNEPITRANVDTAMVKKGYTGRGIFSILNNFGQKTGKINGIKYYEGTSILITNTDAINTIMPHCKMNRKFVVVQKRIKKIKE